MSTKWSKDVLGSYRGPSPKVQPTASHGRWTMISRMVKKSESLIEMQKFQDGLLTKDIARRGDVGK